MSDDILESALVRGLIDGRADFPGLIEQARIVSHLDSRLIEDVRELARALGYADTGTPRDDLLERALLRSAADSLMIVRRDIVERARLRSSTGFNLLVFANADEHAVIRGDIGAGYVACDFTEQAGLGDALSVRMSVRLDVRESAGIRESIGLSEFVDAIERADVRSRWSVREFVRANFGETARVRGWHDISSEDVFDLRESFHAHSFMSVAEDFSGEFYDQIRIVSHLESSGMGMAYAAHPAIFGMSQYVDFPFESLAGVFAAGASGLFAKDDSEVEALFSTGRVTMGSLGLKHLGAMYAVGTHARPMTITVSGDVRGRLESHRYTQQARDAASVRNQKAVLGKGFKSAYFQFALSSAAMFDISGLEVMAEKSERRV